MQASLAAAIALLAGCGFRSPAPSPSSSDSGTEPGADGSVDAPAAGCGSAYDYSYNGHKYRLTGSATMWTQAKADCEGDGGYLLKVDSQAEDDQVERVISFIRGPQEIWIGLRDVDNTGSYVWTDGTAPIYAFWSGAAPNAGSLDCILKNTSSTDGHWYTRDCGDGKAAVCECNL